MSRLPLITAHGLDDVLAWRPHGPVRVADFVAQALAVAESLPDGPYVLNVCEDRYLFALGLAASLLAGKTSLQPASQTTDTVVRLQQSYPGMVCLHDGTAPAAVRQAGLPCLALPQAGAESLPAAAHIPSVATDAVAVVLFTSGSTGLPQAHPKTWGKLVHNGQAEAQALGLHQRPHTLVGTVPVQHSYGLESTLLLAWHGGCTFWGGKPFYPQDVLDVLARVPGPCQLVTTPYHLTLLLDSGLPWPTVGQVLSATAPLGPELAARVEQASGAPVLEIYGSTESSALAWRRTTVGAAWQLLPGVCLDHQGADSYAYGGHVQQRVRLSDLLEPLPDGRFLLQGRHADMVNLAGKRTSLAYLNHQLMQVPGVQDASYFLPDQVSLEGVTRLAAFVVAPGLTRAQVLAALRHSVDTVFLPRPLVLLDALPRNSTGKLTRQALQTLYEQEAQRDPS